MPEKIRQIVISLEDSDGDHQVAIYRDPKKGDMTRQEELHRGLKQYEVTRLVNNVLIGERKPNFGSLEGLR